MNLTLKTPIEKLPRITSAYIEKLHKVGINTVKDMLLYFPFRYDDFSKIKKISEVGLNEIVTIRGKILDIKNTRTWKKKMNLTEALIKDDSGTIKVVWFNQPFLVQNLKKGANVSISGKVVHAREGLQISNPAYEILGNRISIHTACLAAVYHETEGLSSKWLRSRVKSVLKLANDLEEFLPYEVIRRQKLFGIAEAIRQIHFPTNKNKAKIAKRRLAFDELFLAQLYMLTQKRKWQKNKSVKIKFSNDIKIKVKNFVDSLPFKLTSAQKISSWRIIKDLAKDKPMNRLLEGDVGSGKTLVALIAALVVLESNYQVALMTPTEILAKQHFFEAIKRLKDLDKKIAILIGRESRIYENKKGEKTISREKILKKIKNGEVSFLVGTHSLIQEKVIFNNLALSIVDEQHRFGIKQRAKIQNSILGIKDSPQIIPHLLSMTATPIPRTLALAIYGDLDLSILDKTPRGRKKIITKLVPPANRNSSYKFIEDQIKKGRQAFVVCPLIEESEVLEIKSATEEYEILKNEIYPNLSIGLLHGKMKLKEKEKVMTKFSKREIDILVSTSVVEVGIDIPNASVIVIEGAERFGLAQLHQFRGRVGRGDHQSYCFLFTDSASVKTQKRLKALLKSSNGFELAEKDLEIRGPGELAGIRQSGLPDLAMSSLSDTELVKNAREEAKNILKNSSNLSKYPKLLKKLDKFTEKVHFE